MQVLTQFSIYLINQPGVLAAVTAALGRAKINVIALALADSGEHGTLRLVCDDAERARQVLAQTHDRWTESEVLVVELENKPGAFAAVCARLAAGHVNITYAYSTGGAPGGRTNAVFKIAELAKAKKVLTAPKRKSGRKPSRPARRRPPR